MIKINEQTGIWLRNNINNEGNFTNAEHFFFNNSVSIVLVNINHDQTNKKINQITK
jgi:hypothetical protein